MDKLKKFRWKIMCHNQVLVWPTSNPSTNNFQVNSIPIFRYVNGPSIINFSKTEKVEFCGDFRFNFVEKMWREEKTKRHFISSVGITHNKLPSQPIVMWWRFYLYLIRVDVKRIFVYLHGEQKWLKVFECCLLSRRKRWYNESLLFNTISQVHHIYMFEF